MDQIVSIVLPVFGLIAIGYAAAWSGLLGRETGDALADFVFVVAIPVMVFRTLATADLGATSPWAMWLVFFAGFGVNWVGGSLVVRRILKRDARAGLVASVSAAFGNVVLVGIPLSVAAFGEEGAVPIALLITVHLPLTMVLSTVLMERAQRADGVTTGPVDARAVARSFLANIVRNPIIVGLACGFLWRLTGLPIAGVPGILVDRIAGVASTLALISLGLGLRKYDIGGNIRAGAMLSVLKVMVMPAVVFLLARYVVPVPPIFAKVAVVAAACPTGVNAFLIAARFRTGQALASNTIAISTAIAVVTVSFWLTVAQASF